MNKQEAIKRVEQMGEYERFVDEPVSKKSVLNIISQIHEPKKVVVPKYVADWYEENKDYFEWNLYNLCVDFHARKLNEDLRVWFRDMNNKPIETLVMMYKFGYVVKKEKLYTVEIPNPNSAGGKLVLSKQQSTGRLILEMLNSDINKPKYLHLTEDEIKEDFPWLWQFAEEVPEDE